MSLWLPHSNSKTGLNWEVLEQHGITKGKRIKPGVHGDFTIEGYHIVVMPEAGDFRSRKHRIFIECDCGTYVEAGHYGMHLNSKNHKKRTPA